MNKIDAIKLAIKMMKADLYDDKNFELSDDEALWVTKYLFYRIGTKDYIDELTELFTLAGLTLPPQI